MSDIVRHPEGAVVDAMAFTFDDDVITSVIVAGELRTWVSKTGSQRLARLVETTLVAVPALPLEADAADTYAETRVKLKGQVLRSEGMTFGLPLMP